MSEIESKVEDLIRWYFYNEPHIEDIDQRLAFYNKAFSNIIEILALLAKRQSGSEERRIAVPKAIILR